MLRSGFAAIDGHRPGGWQVFENLRFELGILKLWAALYPAFVILRLGDFSSSLSCLECHKLDSARVITFSIAISPRFVDAATPMMEKGQLQPEVRRSVNGDISLAFVALVLKFKQSMNWGALPIVIGLFNPGDILGQGTKRIAGRTVNFGRDVDRLGIVQTQQNYFLSDCRCGRRAVHDIPN